MEGKKMLEQIREIVCDFVEVDPELITEESVLRFDLMLNSFDLINIAVRIEDAFGVQIPDNMITSFRTIGDVVAYIKGQKA